MTYDDIINALFCSEAGALLSDNAALSYPVPSKKDDGSLVDNFFQFFPRSFRKNNANPVSYMGIRADEGVMDYFRKAKPRLTACSANSPLTITDRKEIASNVYKITISDSRQKALAQRYKLLYPKIRDFLFSDSLTPAQKTVLKEYFLVQFSLFGKEISSYRQASPTFYKWMIKTLDNEISFMALLKEKSVRITDLHNFLEMGENDSEKKILLGLSNLSYDILAEAGLNAIRKIIYAEKENKDPQQIVAQDYQHLLAARAYNTHDTANIHIRNERLEEVRQLARDLREEYALQLPVDVFALAEALGIRVEQQQLDPEVDGYAKLDVDEPVITVNTKPARPFYARKRFTLAHEIAHVVIPWHTGTSQCLTDNVYVPGSNGELIDIQEKEANVFASELLIPSDLLRKKKARAMDLKHALDNIIKETKTSTLACLYAMESILGEGEVLCVYSSMSQKWKFFRGPNAGTWETWEDAFALLDNGNYRKEKFIKGTYTVCYYQPDIHYTKERVH